MDSTLCLRDRFIYSRLAIFTVARSGSRRSDRTRKRFRLEGLEDRCLLSITQFPLPLNEGTAPTEIAAGSDGNLWFGFEYNGGYIGMINPTTDAVTEVPVSGFVLGVTSGPDGNVWFSAVGNPNDMIGMINPTTHAWTEFNLNHQSWSGDGPPWVITAGPDGNLWFSDPDVNAIGTINPTTHAISEFALPTAHAKPDGITVGPDGNLWFMEVLAGKVGVINPTTHAITEFTLPAPATNWFEGITTGPDGNLWFTDLGTNSIGMINPTTHAIAEFPVPAQNARLFRITAGANGNLWFTEAHAGQLGEINPTTHAVTEFGIPYSNAYPFGITSSPDGNIWFTDGSNDGPNNAVGVDNLSGDDLVITGQPPASVTAGSGFGLTATVDDSSGNPVTSFNGTVTVALANNPGGSTLGGPLTVTASNGVATFSGLSLNKTGSGYTLIASASGMGSGLTSGITVTAAQATQLVITQQPPSTVKVSAAFGLQVSVEDAYRNVVTNATNVVSVALANNPTGAQLGGTLSVSAKLGVAAFSTLTINKAGNGYTLRLTSAGLTSVVSNAINVTKSGKSPAPAPAAALSTPDPWLAPLVLDSPDLWPSAGPKKRLSIG
jgi:streptogramin lyase